MTDSAVFEHKAGPSDLIIVDVPILLGAALLNVVEIVRRVLTGTIVVSQNAPAELRAAWVANVPGADLLDVDQFPVLPPADPRTAGALAAGRTTRALGETWAKPGDREHRAQSLASAVVAAVSYGVPLLSHEPRAVEVARRRHRARKLQLVGLAGLCAEAVGRRVHSIDAAWELYANLAATEAGAQEDWPVPSSKDAFSAWVKTRFDL